jgi:RNA polymerase sigma-70 factor (ECF subfamily)
MARKFFGTTAEAEDATQDIFLELWRCAARFDEKTASEAAFVVMISRRRLIDRARSRKRERVTVDIDDLAIAAPEASLDLHTDARTAAKVLDGLRADQRNAVVLATVHGMAHEEIASELSIPLGTVKSHIRRGLSLVRAALFGEESREDE